MKFVHFSGLENNLNCSKKDNVILSWNLSKIISKIIKKKKYFKLQKFGKGINLILKIKFFSLRKKFYLNFAKNLTI